MSNRKNAVRGVALNIVCATLRLGSSCLAAADQFGIQIAGGLGDRHVKKLDLGLVWDPNLTWWQIGDWHFALIGEAHVAWWHTDEGNVHENIGEIGVTPIIRFWGVHCTGVWICLHGRLGEGRSKLGGCPRWLRGFGRNWALAHNKAEG
jgi:hypothetical protein